jgi:hypothetical protein
MANKSSSNVFFHEQAAFTGSEQAILQPMTRNRHSQRQPGIAVTSMTQHRYHTVAKSSRHHHRQYDPVSTSRCGQVDSASISSHDQRCLGNAPANFGSAAPLLAFLGGLRILPRLESDSEHHHRSDSGAPGVLLRLTAQLGHAFTYSADLDSRRVRRHHNIIGHFVEPAKSYS